MSKLCVFAGTTEGRKLVEFLKQQQNVHVTACVATEYGESLLKEANNLTISTKRMTQEEMEQLFESEKYDCVIDATHPYASIVTENVVNACMSTGIEYLRLLRDNSDVPEDAVFADDVDAAVEYLNMTQGNILLTTGSKELARFAEIKEFDQRVYARVLPMEASLQACQTAGLSPSHIIAMQGPFTSEMNIATLRSVSAEYMVTKLTGHAGGLDEKIVAAREAGVTLVVIGRPPQQSRRPSGLRKTRL